MLISNSIRPAIHAQPLWPSLTAVAIISLSACGGGGSGRSPVTAPVVPPPATQTSVSGVAAAGKPISGATVTVRDAAGNSTTGTTATDGSFKITSTTKFTPPLVVQVGLGAGATLYSVSADNNLTTTINVTPLTDVIVRSWYNVQGVATDTAFGALASNAAPASATVQVLSGAVQTTLQLWLNSAGVAPGNFNLITSPFKADGTGLDKVLDQTKVTAAAGMSTINVTDGTTTQTSTLKASSGSLTVATTTTNSKTSVTSSALQTVPVVSSPAKQTDLANALGGVQTLFTNLLAAASSKGAGFAATDAAPFVDAGYLNEGKNAAAITGEIARFLTTLPAGAKLSYGGIVRVNDFTDNSPTDQWLNVTVSLIATLSDGSSQVNYLTNNDDLSKGQVYKLSKDGTWQMYGHQSIANATARMEKSRWYNANFVGSPDTPMDTLVLQAQVSVATGTLSAVTFSGPANSVPDCSGITSNTSLAPLTLSSIALPKRPGLFNGNRDAFDLLCPKTSYFPSLGTSPPAGTPYVFALTKAGAAAAVLQNSTLNGASNDNGELTQINGVTRSAFAAANALAKIAGTTLTVTFTPPATYPILYSFISGFCRNAAEMLAGGGSDNQGAHSMIAPATFSDTIAVPASCDGAATADYQINVHFVGWNGERGAVGQDFHL